VSTVRLLPAGVAIATGGVAILLSVIAVLVMLLLARTVVHQLRDARSGSRARS
jgi:hypothetical protein